MCLELQSALYVLRIVIVTLLNNRYSLVVAYKILGSRSTQVCNNKVCDVCV
jgi:hypothetical protein